MNKTNIFKLGAIAVGSMLLFGCSTSSIPGLGAKDLSEGDVIPFIKEAFEQMDENVGYTMTGTEDGEEFTVKYDGTNMSMIGMSDGEDIEMYTIDKDTYMHISMAELGDEPVWIKYPNEDDSDDFITDFSEEFSEENFTDEEITNEFTYIGKEDCPDDMGGICYAFKTDGATAYFTTNSKRLVKMYDDEMTILFDYDNKIKVTLPADAKDAKTFDELFADQFGEL